MTRVGTKCPNVCVCARASLVESEALVESLRQSATPRVTVSNQFSSSFTESMFLESSDPDEHVQQLLKDARLDVEKMKTRLKCLSVILLCWRPLVATDSIKTIVWFVSTLYSLTHSLLRVTGCGS